MAGVISTAHPGPASGSSSVPDSVILSKSNDMLRSICSSAMLFVVFSMLSMLMPQCCRCSACTACRQVACGAYQ